MLFNNKYLLLLTLLLVSLTGCNNKAEPTIRLAHTDWPGYEALSLAKNRSLYKNLDVKIYRPANNSQTERAFKNNIIDIAALTLINAIELQSQIKDPLTIIAVLDMSHGGDVIIAKKSITSIEELAGKKIGVMPSAFGAFFIASAIDSSKKLNVNQVQLVPLTIEKHYQMFTDNMVDAVATYEPTKSIILMEKGHVIFDSSHIPNQIVDVLVTRKSFAQKNPQALTKLLNGYFRAIDLLKHNPDSAISEMAGYENISGDKFKQGLAGIRIPNREENIKLLGGEYPPLLSTAKKINTFMQGNNIITNKSNVIPEISNHYLTAKKK